MITWIGVPFLSAFLFVMGGILVGHLLWYRDRTRDTRAVKDAESKYSRAKATARQRKHQFLDMQKRITSLEQTHEAAEAETRSLAEALEGQKNYSDSLQTEMGKLEAEHSRFELACRDAQAERDRAIERADEAQEQLDQLRQTLSDAEARLGTSSGKMRELADAAERAATEIAKRQNLNERLGESNQELLAEVADLRDQIERFDIRTAEMESSREDILRERNELTHERNELTHERDELTQERDELARERDELAEQLDQTSQQLDETSQQRDDNAREVARLLTQIEQLMSEIELLQTRCDEITLLRDEAVEQRDHAIAQRDQFATERIEVSAKVGESDEKYAALEQEYSALRDQYEIAIAKTTDHTRAIEERVADVNRLEKELAETQIQVQTLQGEHDELLEQLDERTSRIQAAIDGRVTAETALSQLEMQLETLQNELTQANQQRSDYEIKSREIFESTEQLRTHVNELTSSAEAKEATIVTLRSKIDQQDEAISRHRAELQRLSAVRPEFEKLKETVSVKSAELAKAQAESRELQSRLESEVESRERLIAELNDEHKTIRKQVVDQTEMVSRLRRELHGATAQLEAAKAFEPQSIALRQQAERMQSRVDELQQRLRDNAAELEASLDANAKMQDRIKQLEGQLHENAIMMRDLRRKRANVPTLNIEPRVQTAHPNEQRKAA